jgi:hypothetical protein
MKRIAGKDFDVNIGDFLVPVKNATLTVTDNRAVAMDNGVPNGYTDADVAANGEIEVDIVAFQTILDAAKSAGSFKQLEPFDMVFNATVPEQEMRVEAFGCLMKISDLLNIDPSSSDKSTVKIPYDVTDKDFVRINGVPYLANSEIEGL